MSEGTTQVVLKDVDSNTDEAMVDGITLRKGASEPTDLTDGQIQRLKAAGMKLGTVGEADDPLDRIRTHSEADTALAAADLTAPEGATVQEKVDLLRENGE